MMSTPHNWQNASEVLSLFLIPIGGGIPAGVLLAKAKGLHWLFTSTLYLISDIILAIVFEPLMLLFLRAAQGSRFLKLWMTAHKQNLDRLIKKYGLNPSPFRLIMISFGIDPMTGRSLAKAVGHGFMSGWAIAIAGDMIFYFVLMASTLWLNNILGDGTITVLIILALMLLGPVLIEKIKGYFHKHP